MKTSGCNNYSSDICCDHKTLWNNSMINQVHFGDIIQTDILWNWCFFLSDTKVVEKEVIVNEWNQSVDKWMICFSTASFPQMRFDYILYSVDIFILDQHFSQKEIIVDSDGETLCFFVILNDIQPNQDIPVTITVSGGVVYPVFHIPLSVDYIRDNNVAVCWFTLS